jgi:hypothetical protein
MPELYSLNGWRVIAGPPNIEIGSLYYAPIIEASKRKRQGETELIRPRRFCQRCGAKLPVWINGKQVRADRKFCDACRP